MANQESYLDIFFFILDEQKKIIMVLKNIGWFNKEWEKN